MKATKLEYNALPTRDPNTRLCGHTILSVIGVRVGVTNSFWLNR